jgi:hypothetical protein
MEPPNVIKIFLTKIVRNIYIIVNWFLGSAFVSSLSSFLRPVPRSLDHCGTNYLEIYPAQLCVVKNTGRYHEPAILVLGRAGSLFSGSIARGQNKYPLFVPAI